MNLPIAILLLCAMLGLVDKILGNRMGLGEEFDRGLTMMGSLALTMSGIYCFSVMLGRWLAVWLQGVSLPFDPTLLVSSVLATDMGAYSIAQTICTPSRAAGAWWMRRSRRSTPTISMGAAPLRRS